MNIISLVHVRKQMILLLYSSRDMMLDGIQSIVLIGVIPIIIIIILK